MKFSNAVLAALPALVVAHGDHDLNARHQNLNARQSPATPNPVGPATSLTAVSGVTPIPTATLPMPSVSLLATNPTAVPLSVINAAQPSSATSPLASTAVPGTTPTFLPGAPPLPNGLILNPADYPTLDKPPPINSSEVQQWIQDVANSGIVIPNIAVTNLGGCPNNTEAAADTSRCWWTCGGCTRPTDIVDCPTALTWGLTYDDGPSFYTSNLLSYLDQVNLKSTFFVVGSRAISFPPILQTEYMGQHQIAVHTWSHPSLTTLSNEEIIAELGWTKKVIKDILGVTPNMMRPPFGDIDDRVRAISLAMGLTPVMWTRISPLATFDTDDFNIHGGTTSVQQVLQNWENILGNASVINNGFIVLEHDLFEQTVEVATGYILPDAMAHNPSFKIQPVIECRGQPLANAYIETNNNSTNPPAISAAISQHVVNTTGSAAGAQSTGGNGKSAGISIHLSAGAILPFITASVAVLAGAVML